VSDRADPPAKAQAEVFAFLEDPATHGIAERPQRIDTHAAAVFLAGRFAYKVKRAVRYPYLDFSTLDRRRAACEAEIRLNRENAPDIYLDTIAITRRGDALHLGDGGEIVEWAVRMRRFDPGDTLDHVADRGALDDGVLAVLVEAVVAAHDRAPAGDGEVATRRLAGVIEDNVSELAGEAVFPSGRVVALGRAWEASYADVADLLRARGRAGHVRRCHGDLHLRNIVMVDGRPRLFDALEFDDDLATTDVLYDLAFLLMDLWERGHRNAANTVRNRYLWQRDADTDIEACAALPLFMSLRAAIRAKVALASLPHLGEVDREDAARAAQDYFAAAETFMEPAPLRLVAVGGLSGTGKTTVSASLAPHIGRVPGAVHLRSDIERKRLFGVADTQRLPEDAYGKDVTERVYDRLRRRAMLALRAGQSVVVDAVHEREGERSAIEAVARDAGARFAGLWLEAEKEEMLSRVANRRGDASDADGTVVLQQLSRRRDGVNWTRIRADGEAEEVCARALAATS
jgi:uncharacterized protein